MAARKTERKPETVQRYRRIMDLRAQGLTWEKIGELEGITKAGAWAGYQQGLKMIIAESVDEIRTIESERLNTAQAAIWPQVLNGDTGAIHTLLKIMDRRAKLFGLDMPVRVQQEIITFEGGTEIDREIQRLTNLLTANSGTAVNMAEPISEAEPITASE